MVESICKILRKDHHLSSRYHAVHSKSRLHFRLRQSTTSGTAGGSHRVFVSGTPWPVAVLYRDINTVPEIDPVILSHLRFGHADCRRIDKFLTNNISTGINFEKGENTKSNPATNCSICKLVKAPRPGRFPRQDPQRHQWRDVNAYLSTDICGPISPASTTGHRYIIVFVCRSSGYTHLYFLKKKSEAPDILSGLWPLCLMSAKNSERMSGASDFFLRT